MMNLSKFNRINNNSKKMRTFLIIGLLTFVMVELTSQTSAATLVDFQSDNFNYGTINSPFEAVYPTGTDDYEWRGVQDFDVPVVPMIKSGADASSYTYFQQQLTIPRTGTFDFQVQIYKYAYNTASDMRLQILDDADNLIAEVGVYDAWASSSYKQIGHTYRSDGTIDSYTSGFLSSDFNKVVRIWRDGNSVVHTSIDGSQKSTSTNTNPIKTVRLRYFNYWPNSYDSELVNRLDRFWFDNFVYSHSTQSSFQDDSFTTVIGSQWEEGFQTGSEDFDWVIASSRAVPKILSAASGTSITYLQQTLSGGYNGAFQTGVEVYKYASNTASDMRLQVLNDEYELVAEVGLYDAWSSSSYKKVGFVWDNSRTRTDYISSAISSNFQGDLVVNRDDSGTLRVELAGNTLVSTINTENIKSIRLRYFNYWPNSYDSELIGKTDKFWFDNFFFDNSFYGELEESQFDWLAVPTSNGNSFSTTWTAGSSGRHNSLLYGNGYYEGFSVVDKLMVDETFTNVLNIHRDGGFLYYLRKSNIQLNTVTDFSISIDYKTNMISSELSSNPGFKVTWASGGEAWIKDTAGTGAQWGIKSQVSAVTSSKLYDNHVYRLQIKGDATNIYVMIYDLSTNLDRPSTNKNDAGWITLQTYPRDGSFQGEISVRIGSLSNEDYPETYADEQIYYANLAFTTGIVPGPEASFHLHDIPRDQLSSSLDYDVEECEMGVGQTAQGPACYDFYVGEGAIGLVLTDYLNNGDIVTLMTFGNEEQHDYNVYFRADSLSVTRYEIFRPWFYLTSNNWHATEFKYSQSDYQSVSITQTFDKSTTVNAGGTTGGTTARLTSSQEDSFTQSVALPSVTAQDGATVSVYIKYYMYEIKSTFSKYCITCGSGDELQYTRDFEGFVMTRINPADRILVHSALNIEEIRGSVNGVEELSSSPITVSSNSDPYDVEFDLKSSTKRSVSQSISFNFGAKISGKISGIGVGVSASVKFTTSQSLTSTETTALKYKVHLTPSNLGSSTFYTIIIERFNNFGLLVRRS